MEERRIAYLARYFCTCKLFISFNSCCSFMTWELLPVFDGWEYGNQNRENHLSRVMWLSFWSSHLNAGGHLLFLSWDPSYDPLPTILGLWVFHKASLGAPCPPVTEDSVISLPPLPSSRLANGWKWIWNQSRGCSKPREPQCWGDRMWPVSCQGWDSD